MKIWTLFAMLVWSSTVIAQNDQSDLPFSKAVRVGIILYLLGERVRHEQSC